MILFYFSFKVAPKKQSDVVDCITLKAFDAKKQATCIKQLKNSEDIKKIAGATFTFPRTLVHLEDDEVKVLGKLTRLVYSFFFI